MPCQPERRIEIYRDKKLRDDRNDSRHARYLSYVPRVLNILIFSVLAGLLSADEDDI